MIEGKDYEIIDGRLKIFNNVEFIEDYAFTNIIVTSIYIPDSVTNIGEHAFDSNKISKMIISNNVKTIGPQAFRGNELEALDLPDNLVSLGFGTFAANTLKTLKISKALKVISRSAFSYNELSDVEIPYGVTTIEAEAFFHNNLTSINIPNSVVSIGSQAFAANKLESVSIPSSVINIGEFAFDLIDIIYDGVFIGKDMVKKYECDNIINIYQLQKIIPMNEIYKMPKAVLQVIPATEDAIKGYILNRKVFENLNTFADTSDEYKDFFKMCFALGLFNKPDEEVIGFIKQIKEENTVDYIHQMWTAVKLSRYKPKFKILFMKLYNEGKTDYEGQNIIGRLYSSFEKINKYTIKKHEEEISKKNTEIKRLKELGANTTLLERELEKLKKNKKNIEYEDITYYIKNNAFDIREGNEEIKSVVDTLSVHMEQEDFDIIQDMYEESLEVEKTIPLTKDTSDKDFKYHWSKSDNPINTILGYIVDCCAKLGGAGEDIMRQSMINPDVANLIIYDENNTIIGKATAYYNRSKKYILFNNAETKEIGTKGLKSAKQRQKECLEALLRGVNDTVKTLKERGEDIGEVRIGMLRNDLESAIKDYGLEISHELLKSYNWQGYAGDASDIEKGQAIIYKDEEVYNKGKDHI